MSCTNCRLNSSGESFSSSFVISVDSRPARPVRHRTRRTPRIRRPPPAAGCRSSARGRECDRPSSRPFPIAGFASPMPVRLDEEGARSRHQTACSRWLLLRRHGNRPAGVEAANTREHVIVWRVQHDRATPPLRRSAGRRHRAWTAPRSCRCGARSRRESGAMRPWTGHAAASPSAQIVWPSTWVVTSSSMSISRFSARPSAMRSSTRHIQPVPSRQGVHWPQLSCL